jgi:hypothetical protein
MLSATLLQKSKKAMDGIGAPQSANFVNEG